MLTDLQKSAAKKFAQGCLGDDIIKEFGLSEYAFRDWLKNKEFNDEIIYHIYTLPPFNRIEIREAYNRMFGED